MMYESRNQNLNELEELFCKRCEEYKEKILGSDASMMYCGFVDTDNGFGMTAEHVLHIMRAKRAADIAKRT